MSYYTSVSKSGNFILWTGYENGKKVIKKEPICSRVYVGDKKSPILDLKKDKFNIHEFNSSWDASNYIKSSHLQTFSAPNPEVEFIVDKFKNKELEFNPNNFQIAWFDIETNINEKRDFPATTEFVVDKKENEYNNSQFSKSKNSLIASYACYEEINAVTISVPNYQFKGKQKTFTFTTFNYTGELLKNEDYSIKSFATEKEMLVSLISFIKQERFDFIIGFNSSIFDIPFLVGRIMRVLGETVANTLSPFGKISKKTVSIYGNEYITYNIAGLVSIDYLDLFKKFNFKKRASFSLDSICADNIDWTKIPNPSKDFRLFYEGTYDIKYKPSESEHKAIHMAHKRFLMKKDGLQDTEEYKKHDKETIQEAQNLFLEYNIRDVLLLIKLEEKIKYFNLMGIVAYIMRSNFVDVLGTIRMWENKVYSYLKLKDKVPMSRGPQKERQPYPGGYVKDTIKGWHKYMITYDYQSLYPSIIMALGLSPEKNVGMLPDEIFKNQPDAKIEDRTLNNDYLIENDYAMGANGFLIKRGDTGFIVDVTREVFFERKKVKNEMLKLKDEVEQSQIDTGNLTMTDVLLEMKKRKLLKD